MCIKLVFIFWVTGAILSWWGYCARAWADETKIVSISNDPDFSDVHTQLQALVNTFGFHAKNKFCIVAYKAQDDDTIVPYVYWPSQNKLIVWGFGSKQIMGATGYIDLTHDISPNGAPIPPQDYIQPWTQADVDKLVKDCRIHGTSYSITKTDGGWVPIDKFLQFSSVRKQLQYLVDKDATQNENSFCVVGQRDGTYLAAYVYWQTEDRLIFWLPSQYDEYDFDALSDSLAQIDLNHGLKDNEDISEGHDEMQRSYAEAILRACETSGQKFTFMKSN